MKNHQSSESLKWSHLFYIPVLWLAFGATVGAFSAWAMKLSDYGFSIVAFVSVLHGLAGAVAHCVLFLLPWFRHALEPVQVLLLWVCTLVAMLVLQMADSVSAGSKISLDVLVIMSVPVLVAATVFNRIVRR